MKRKRADVIVDNIQSGALSGSKAAALNGGWVPVPRWRQAGRYRGMWDRIGISGSYHVYEWYGNTAENHASDVPYQVAQSEGTTKR